LKSSEVPPWPSDSRKICANLREVCLILTNLFLEVKSLVSRHGSILLKPSHTYNSSETLGMHRVLHTDLALLTIFPATTKLKLRTQNTLQHRHATKLIQFIYVGITLMRSPSPTSNSTLASRVLARSVIVILYPRSSVVVNQRLQYFGIFSGVT
jgi:hypothetical protein